MFLEPCEKQFVSIKQKEEISDEALLHIVTTINDEYIYRNNYYTPENKKYTSFTVDDVINNVGLQLINHKIEDDKGVIHQGKFAARLNSWAQSRLDSSYALWLPSIEFINEILMQKMYLGSDKSYLQQ